MPQSPLSGDQYRLLVEAAPTLVWRAGLDTKCDYFNETWLAFTGRSLDDEVGEGWVAGVHPDDVERCVDVYLSRFARREAFEMEYRLRRNDGVYRWIFDRGVPFDADGGFAGFIGSCVDVHERHEADEAKTTFLSMLAHELRTPLQPLTMYVEELARHAELAQPVTPIITQRIGRQVERLRALVDRAAQGISLARGMALELQLEPLDLMAVIEGGIAAQLAGGRARSVSATIETTVRGTPRRIEGSAVHLAQVLDVLVDNAIKYSPDGGPIRLSVSFERDAVRIEVDDDGIGVPQEELSRVGTPYFRASNVSARRYAGLGLGLAVARDVIAAHGGTLTLEPRAPKGTRASVVLPASGGAP